MNATTVSNYLFSASEILEGASRHGDNKKARRRLLNRSSSCFKAAQVVRKSSIDDFSKLSMENLMTIKSVGNFIAEIIFAFCNCNPSCIEKYKNTSLSQLTIQESRNSKFSLFLREKMAQYENDEAKSKILTLGERTVRNYNVEITKDNLQDLQFGNFMRMCFEEFCQL